MTAPPRNVTKHGYVRIHVPGHPVAHAYGWAYEHRVVAYDAGLIRADDPRHVHHVNHDRTDNRPENLQVLEPEEHQRHHSDDRRRLDPTEVAGLYQQGLTTVEVAERLGTHGATVSRILAKAGVKARTYDYRFPLDEDEVERMIRFGVRVRAIARHFGCAAIVISRIKRQRNLPAQPTGRPPKDAPTIEQYMRSRA